MDSMEKFVWDSLVLSLKRMIRYFLDSLEENLDSPSRNQIHIRCAESIIQLQHTILYTIRDYNLSFSSSSDKILKRLIKFAPFKALSARYGELARRGLCADIKCVSCGDSDLPF